MSGEVIGTFHGVPVVVDPQMIAGYVPMSAQLADDVRRRQAALDEMRRLSAIGPWHGPVEPPVWRLLRCLPGHPAGRLRRAA